MPSSSPTTAAISVRVRASVTNWNEILAFDDADGLEHADLPAPLTHDHHHAKKMIAAPATSAPIRL